FRILIVSLGIGVSAARNQFVRAPAQAAALVEPCSAQSSSRQADPLQAVALGHESLPETAPDAVFAKLKAPFHATVGRTRAITGLLGPAYSILLLVNLTPKADCRASVPVPAGFLASRERCNG